MPNVNKVILIGNLTRDPEIRQLPGGGMIASFGLAMTRRYTNARQELVEEPCFVEVSAFQRNAEIVQQFVHKGDPLYVEGRLRYDAWDDKQTGAKRNRLTVVCENLQLLTRRNDTAPQGAATPYRQAPAQRPAYGAAPQYGAQQYAAPQQPMGYDQAVPAPQQYRSAAPMPSFQGNDAPEPPQEAPVDDIPF